MSNVYKFSVFEEDLLGMAQSIMVPIVQVELEEVKMKIAKLEDSLEEEEIETSLSDFHDARIMLKKLDTILGEWQESLLHLHENSPMEKAFEDVLQDDITLKQLNKEGEELAHALKVISRSLQQVPNSKEELEELLSQLS